LVIIIWETFALKKIKQISITSISTNS